ncbi:MAG: acyl-CoA dehydrogenase family protein [Verrucomicrobia bacterium]|nr:acyl-CoA dehydrogenase family protein [Verrucomicrobiota bacterium]
MHPSHDPDMVVDTSGMSNDKRAAMEVAEAARGGIVEEPSFAGEMFDGRFRPDLVFPFPPQSDDERKIGDDLIEPLFKYLETHLDPEEVDETRTIPQAVIDEMARFGVFAMKVPAEYGGLGLSQVNYNRVMMRFASLCGSTAVLVSAHQSIGVPQPLKMFGTEAQKKKYFPRFREGAISAFALTEPDVGSDPAKMATTAVPSEDGSHYVLNGEKLWCTNGPIAELLVVMAKTPPRMVRGREKTQISAFIVEGQWDGIEQVHRCDFMGIRGIQNGLMRFRDVRVPAENLLGEEGKGLKLALATLNTGRLTIPAACTGAAKQCLSIVRRWGGTRTQWGSPVGKHEAGRQKLAYIAATTFAMEAITFLVSHWADRGDMDIRIEAAMAKLFCSEHAWDVVDQTLQLRGGRGYEKASSLAARGEEPFPVERMMREMRINRIIEGTTEIMHLFLAREALDPHLRLASDLLKRGVPLSRKLAAAGKLVRHYAAWYPAQWVNASLWRTHSEAGALAGHVKYVDRTSHRLARALFHAMMRHQSRLELRQVLLGQLIDIGTELFAMSATCSYARHEAQRRGDQTPIEVADIFCVEARGRIENSFSRIHGNATRRNNRFAKRVLSGDLKWIEEGITWIGQDE